MAEAVVAIVSDNHAVPEEGSHRGSVAVRDLRVSYEGRALLDGISAGIRPRSITALVGPTGSGKTTLLRVINRMHDATPGMRVSGLVTVGGQDVYRDFPDVRELRRRVGMVFQRANPFPRSILENVIVAPRAHRLHARSELRGLAEAKLSEVGLWKAVAHRLHASPFGLSGGQQQLLCLSRALAVSPEVLLLDEPTSALDPATTEHIESLIRRLGEHMTVIIVTHNLAQARRISDSVIFLMDGRLVEHSPAERFFRAPADERSAAYVSGRIG